MVRVRVNPPDAVVLLAESLGYKKRSIETDAVLVVGVLHVAKCGQRYFRHLCQLAPGDPHVLAKLLNSQLVDFRNEPFGGDVNQLLIVVVQHDLCRTYSNTLMLKSQ